MSNQLIPFYKQDKSEILEFRDVKTLPHKTYKNKSGTVIANNTALALATDIRYVTGTNVTYNAATQTYTVAAETDTKHVFTNNANGTTTAQLKNKAGTNVGSPQTIGHARQILTSVGIATNCLVYADCP